MYLCKLYDSPQQIPPPNDRGSLQPERLVNCCVKKAARTPIKWTRQWKEASRTYRFFLLQRHGRKTQRRIVENPFSILKNPEQIPLSPHTKTPPLPSKERHFSTLPRPLRPRVQVPFLPPLLPSPTQETKQKHLDQKTLAEISFIAPIFIPFHPSSLPPHQNNAASIFMCHGEQKWNCCFIF